MRTDTGEIEYLDDEAIAEMKDFLLGERLYSQERKMISLSNEEAKDCETMPLYQRKGYMRNKPCVCGSGKKFKKCCWSKFS